ncbi:unnamed protein product, partial [Oikopleura dioica]
MVVFSNRLDYEPAELTEFKGRSQAEQLPLRNINPNGKWEGFLDNSAVIIGGLPRYLWGTTASPVTSSEGYLGCVGNIQLNGNTMFLQQNARQIEKGCSGPLVACSAFYCKNGGLCRQGWDGPKCDCSGTSFIGDTCTKLVGGQGEFRDSGAVVIVPLPLEDSLSSDLISVLIQVPDKPNTNTEPSFGLLSPNETSLIPLTVQTILTVTSSGTSDAFELNLVSQHFRAKSTSSTLTCVVQSFHHGPWSITHSQNKITIRGS